MILGYLLTNGHLGALVVSVVTFPPSLLIEPSLLVREQWWMREPPQQEVSSRGYEKSFKKNWTQPSVQATKAPSTISEPCAPITSVTGGATEVLTRGSRSRNRCSSCGSSRCNWSRQRYDTSARQPSKKRERLRSGSPFPNHACVSRTQRERVGGQIAGREVRWTFCGRGDQEGVPRPSNWNVPQPSEWQKSRRQAD